MRTSQNIAIIKYITTATPATSPVNQCKEVGIGTSNFFLLEIKNKQQIKTPLITFNAKELTLSNTTNKP